MRKKSEKISMRDIQLVIYLFLRFLSKKSEMFQAFDVPNHLSMIRARAPSPVTLHAVPKLSMAIYSAIISAYAFSSNPSMDDRIPREAIMAPPGTPGAATMVTPSMNMNPANIWKS